MIGSAASTMDAGKLHIILGRGDVDLWKSLVKHEHSFVYVEVGEAERAVAVHEFAWDVSQRTPRLLPTGVLATVVCRKHSDAGKRVRFGQTFRVHVCRNCPCNARYDAAKYGGHPPPIMHGRVLRLCGADEAVNLKSEWVALHHRLHEDVATTSAVAAASESVAATSAVAAAADSFATGAQQAASAESAAASVEWQMVVSSSTTVSAAAENTEWLGAPPLPVDSSAPAAAGMAPTSANVLPISASASGPSGSVELTVAIINRAEHISVAGQWIGLLEIIAFCALIKQRVILQLDGGDLDVMAALAPAAMG